MPSPQELTPDSFVPGALISVIHDSHLYISVPREWHERPNAINLQPEMATAKGTLLIFLRSATEYGCYSTGLATFSEVLTSSGSIRLIHTLLIQPVL